MNLKNILTYSAKILVLTLFMIVCFVLATQISGLSKPTSEYAESEGSNKAALFALVISSFFEVVILSIIIIRSKINGVKLLIVISLAFYGSMTFIYLNKFKLLFNKQL